MTSKINWNRKTKKFIKKKMKLFLLEKLPKQRALSTPFVKNL
jgi:hypothetical protein